MFSYPNKNNDPTRQRVTKQRQPLNRRAAMKIVALMTKKRTKKITEL